MALCQRVNPATEKGADQYRPCTIVRQALHTKEDEVNEERLCFSDKKNAKKNHKDKYPNPPAYS